MSVPGPGECMPHTSRVFLTVGWAVLVAAVAGVWWWTGWHNAVWASWAGLFALLEGHALWSETPGDTLSERLREWLRLKTPAGRWGFFVMLGTLFAWLSFHLVAE